MQVKAPIGQIEVPPSKETTCAIYITYHPDAQFPQRVARVAPQVAHVIIVDNHSNGQAVGMLRALCQAIDSELIENQDNLGMATALNQGVRRAIEQGYAWALTLDQDSWPEEHLVQALSEIYLSHPERKLLKMIGSNYVKPITGRSALLSYGAIASHVEVEVVITSCSLMSLKDFEEIGPFRDDFFIDQVDAEYCLRLRSRGYTVVMSSVPLMVHPIGSETMHKLLYPRICSNHSPLRRYYITRNRLVLYRKYIFQEPQWVLKSLNAALREVIFIILFEKDKTQKLKSIFMGIYHALSGRMGKLQTEVLG
jgi:rhamnosyltransferase